MAAKEFFSKEIACYAGLKFVNIDNRGTNDIDISVVNRGTIG